MHIQSEKLNNVENLIEPYCSRMAVCRPHEVIYEANDEYSALTAVNLLVSHGYESSATEAAKNIWFVTTCIVM